MSSIVQRIAEIEKELLALTANQPPNPANLTTYRVDRTTTVNNEEKTVVFASGTPSYLQLYTSGEAILIFDSGDIKIYASTSGTSYTVISLGAFSLV